MIDLPQWLDQDIPGLTLQEGDLELAYACGQAAERACKYVQALPPERLAELIPAEAVTWEVPCSPRVGYAEIPMGMILQFILQSSPVRTFDPTRTGQLEPEKIRMVLDGLEMVPPVQRSPAMAAAICLSVALRIHPDDNIAPVVEGLLRGYLLHSGT